MCEPRLAACRSPFIRPTGIGVLLFKCPPEGCTGVHISASGLNGVMNQGNYFTMMGAIKGGPCLPFHSIWAPVWEH